ncbi:MAG: DUF1802 family protein [Cyanobacteria bacterium P01_A01_bin.45]
MNQVNLTNFALKEWETAINALQGGKTIMLLRKGGIHERQGKFQVSQEQVLLYPTYEHQQSFMLKEEYSQRVRRITPGWCPEKVCISSWAKITDILPINDESVVNSLSSFHIWNQDFICDRLKWKPSQPLYVLLLRVYQLPQIKQIPFLPRYRGCKSWIELAEYIDISNTQPIISDSKYSQLVHEIRSTIGNKILNLVQ